MSERFRSSRRTVCQLFAATLLAIPASAGAGARPDRHTTDDAERYVAVVDRIVDGEHVVLLLEEDGDLVDQLVVSVDEFDEVAEGDILLVAVDLEDEVLVAYEHVDERPADDGWYSSH